MRLIGASGTLKIYTLLDSSDCKESPLQLVAVTLAEMNSPQSKLNGVSTNVELLTEHFVSVMVVESDPSQTRDASVKVTPSDSLNTIV